MTEALQMRIMPENELIKKYEIREKDFLFEIKEEVFNDDLAAAINVMDKIPVEYIKLDRLFIKNNMSAADINILKNDRKKGRQMINYFIDGRFGDAVSFIGIMAAFFLTCFFMVNCSGMLPKDAGRAFAHDGKLSAGKPRGAGFIFVLVFIGAGLLFGEISRENIIYIVLTAAAMMTGFLDDCAKTPWGEYKKGLLDLIIAVMVAVTFLNFNSNEVYLAVLNRTIVIPPLLFGLLTVILVWVSINVTNCSDGVDGLSGTLTIITLLTLYIIDRLAGADSGFAYLLLIFVACVLGYLWFNATPSILMMGDAGSRAMGLFIAIASLKTGSPFLYLLAALVLILDGGLGLIKVALLRFLKIKILANTRTPLHDHVRKIWNWSNTQAVYRFAIVQIVISVAVVYFYIL